MDDSFNDPRPRGTVVPDGLTVAGDRTRRGWIGLLVAAIVAAVMVWLLGALGKSDGAGVVAQTPLPAVQPALSTPSSEPSARPSTPFGNRMPIVFSTVFGQMEWRRITGPLFGTLSRARAEPEPSTLSEVVDWGVIGWPPTGWVASELGLLDENGAGASLYGTSGGWEDLAVEDPEVAIRKHWLVAGPAGVLLVGDPWGSDVPIMWRLPEADGFAMSGPLPFQPDHMEGRLGRPMLYPVTDGFLAMGRLEGDGGEVTLTGPDQQLWMSKDGASWVRIDDDPFAGEWIDLLAGHGGRWMGVQTGGAQGVWVSADGAGWERVGEAPPLGERCEHRLVGGAPGWVLVDDCRTDRTLWLSRDGREWQGLPTQVFEGFEHLAGNIQLSAEGVIVDSAPWPDTFGWVGTILPDGHPLPDAPALPLGSQGCNLRGP